MKCFTWKLLLAVVALTVVPTAWAGQFQRVTYYKVGSDQQPRQVVSAHLTHSGNLDLAITDYITEKLSILLGNGDGTFQKPLTFPVPAPVGIAAGDFNEDGIQDLAVVESGGTGNGAIAIFLGDGRGHFKLSASYEIGIESGEVAIADLNGDGHLDVAVTNPGFEGGGNMMTFFGNGHGELKDRKTYKLGGQPAGIAAGDLNGDGHPDLAVATNQEHTVAVLMNDGTGKFGKPVSYSVDGDPVDVKIADLRNNGKQDLVVADDASGLDVWLNNGDGTFGKPTTYPPTCDRCLYPPEACTIDDFNQDGNLDVACATIGADSYFFYGKGNGKFGSPRSINESIHGEGGFSIASGDFNNDSAPDLTIPIQNYGKVAILLNTK
jgi:hypothetical protein